MTADEFRILALALLGSTESQHMGHPDFRAHGRIFATLGYPDISCAMVKLSPGDQKRLTELHPHIFTPVKGAWGLAGSTTVHLSQAKTDIVQNALDMAWQQSAINTAAKKPAKSAKKRAPKKQTIA